MITKWKLFNFKSVRQETELELAPLTILAGPNSSGKSTWTQSILLISQTLASKVSSRSVVLNGHLTKLGQFDDLRSFNSEADQILIGWECEPYSESVRRIRDRLTSVSCELFFDIDPSSPQRDLMQLQPRLFSYSLTGVARDEDNIDQRFELALGRVEKSNDQITGPAISELGQIISSSAFDYDIKLDTYSLEELLEGRSTRKPLGCELIHFLPNRIPVVIDKAQEEAEYIISIICEEDQEVILKSNIYRRYTRRGLSGRELTRYFPREAMIPIPNAVVDSLRAYLGDLIEPLLRPTQLTLPIFTEEDTGSVMSVLDWYTRLQDLPDPTQGKIRQAILEHKDEITEEINRIVLDQARIRYTYNISRVPRYLSSGIDYLNSFFSKSIKYLGPLRDEPKALYPLAPTVDPSDIGLRGEYTAAVLDLHKEDFISYLPSTNFNEPLVKKQATTRSLDVAVLDWLKYMGVAERVETRDRGKLGHELKIITSDSDKPQDLTHVGVGVSQVLPIVVMCLLADIDTTLIIEQPELHLHPKVQTLLADFFLSMALLGKQCIIETHSEYLINRLRFRAASATEDDLSSLMKIYFVEKKDGVSSFRDVVVNKYGAITDWPEGFFDQSQNEAEEILRAATLKRKQERGARKDA